MNPPPPHHHYQHLLVQGWDTAMKVSAGIRLSTRCLPAQTDDSFSLKRPFWTARLTRLPPWRMYVKRSDVNLMLRCSLKVTLSCSVLVATIRRDRTRLCSIVRWGSSCFIDVSFHQWLTWYQQLASAARVKAARPHCRGHVTRNVLGPADTRIQIPVLDGCLQTYSICFDSYAMALIPSVAALITLLPGEVVWLSRPARPWRDGACVEMSPPVRSQLTYLVIMRVRQLTRRCVRAIIAFKWSTQGHLKRILSFKSYVGVFV